MRTDYNAWVRDGLKTAAGTGFAPEYREAEEGTVILAMDQVGDAVVVVRPGGVCEWRDANGGVFGMDEAIDGTPAWESLRALVVDGIMYIG